MRTVEVKDWDDQDNEQPATCMRKIGLDGIWYETDLSDVSSKELDEAVRRFIEKARKLPGGKLESTKLRPGRDTAAKVIPPPDPPAQRGNANTPAGKRRSRIREWAERQSDIKPKLPESWEQSYIPTWVEKAYNVAHPEDVI